MAAILAGTATELGTLRSRFAAAVSAGADAGTLWSEMVNAVDVLGRAMQATQTFMEDAERKQVEHAQVVGLHSSSIASLRKVHKCVYAGTTKLKMCV